VAHTTATTHAVRSAAVLAVTVALLSGCLGSADCSAGGEAVTFRAMMAAEFGASPAAASCASGVEFEGRFLMAWSDGLPAVRGKSLGTATYPVCDDGGGCDGQVDTASGSTKVWALRGFDPEEIVVARSEGSRKLVVYARPDAEPDDYFRLAGGRWHLRTHAKSPR
jgi:hypothetical protein